MRLEFPPLSGGIAQGLNDAGIETFEGDLHHFVMRECGQNSLDAAASPSKPVRIEVQQHFLSGEDMPFIPDLKNAFDACRDYWKADTKSGEFFAKAKSLASKKNICCLRISDYETTGVPGGDHETDGPWFGLVRSRGVSIKTDAGSAGAFGIGKDAPLAASAFRTVIYSTMSAAGNTALQGVCRLATSGKGDGETQGTGFIGAPQVDKKRPFPAIRDPKAIPEIFRRKEQGLDVWVIGFRGEHEDWERPFVAAALGNFWPAISYGKIELTIGPVKITREGLAGLMQKYSTEEEVADALPYFRALTSGTASEKRLDHAGQCKLHLFRGDSDLPRKICMTRKTGMVIFHYAPRTVRLPFSGLFHCSDPQGNLRLKNLEPPRHDNWEQKRSEKAGDREALASIKEWIKTSLRALIPDLDSVSFNEDSIADVLPDEDLPVETEKAQGEPDLPGTPKGAEITKVVAVPPPAVRTEGKQSDGRGKGGKGGEKDGDVTDPGGPGDGKNTGGKKGETSREGDQGGGPVKPRLFPLDLRSYRDAVDPDTYHLVARSQRGYSGNMVIQAVTEEGAGIRCPLEAASDDHGKQLTIDGSEIKSVTIQPGQPLKLSVKLKGFGKVAIRVSGHEKQ